MYHVSPVVSWLAAPILLKYQVKEKYEAVDPVRSFLPFHSLPPHSSLVSLLPHPLPLNNLHRKKAMKVIIVLGGWFYSDSDILGVFSEDRMDEATKLAWEA